MLICFWHSTLGWRHNEHDSVSNHQPYDCFLNRLFRRRSKKTSKFRVTGLCAGNSPGTGEFSAQMASNAENVSIWWRHHEESIKDERKGKLRHGVLLQQDNSPIHINQVFMHVVCNRGCKLPPHLPYFLDLAPCYYFRFSKLKKEFRDHRYVDDNELTLALEEFCRECGSAFYR